MIAGGAAAIVGGILSVALIPSREGPFGASAASVVSPTPPRKASPGSLHQQSTSLRVKLRLVLGNSVVLVLAWCTFAMYIVRSGLSDWSVTRERAIRAMRPRDHTPDDAASLLERRLTIYLVRQREFSAPNAAVAIATMDLGGVLGAFIAGATAIAATATAAAHHAWLTIS